MKTKILVPWRHVAAHLAGAVATFGVAWLAFLSLGDRAQFALDRLGRWRWLSALGAGMRWLAPVVWIAGLVKVAGMTDAAHLHGDSPVGEQSFSRRETKRYEFLFRTAQTTAAQPMLGAADRVYEKVATFLGASPLPSRVVVDLASTVMSHAAGQTNWTKIRIPLQGDTSLDELRLILGHETTHVFIEQLSNGRLTDHFNEIRFLHEGLATYVELRLFGSEEDETQNRRAIAGAWSRGKVPLESLMNDRALGQKREPYLVYPLGEAFAQALVDTHGREAPARLLRAFARKDAPSGLSGAALWRDTMQAAGLSLDRVAAAYDANCAAARKEEESFVTTLPRLAATTRLEKGNIVVQPFSWACRPAKSCATRRTAARSRRHSWRWTGSPTAPLPGPPGAKPSRSSATCSAGGPPAPASRSSSRGPRPCRNEVTFQVSELSSRLTVGSLGRSTHHGAGSSILATGELVVLLSHHEHDP